MNHLLRELAPITDRAWEEIEEEARRQLVVTLAARKLVDFSGPHGWERSATNLGRTEPLPGTPVDGVDARRRRVLPLVEPRASFSLSRAELEAVDRGAEDVDLDALAQAARRIALTENTAVFNGWGEAGIIGIAQASPHEPVPLTELERMIVLTSMAGTTGWHYGITRHARYAPHFANYNGAAAGRTFPSAEGHCPP